jgi:hypothetical protein
LERESWISVQQVRSSAQVRLLLPVLDRGEAEVIALALEQQAKLVLLDELTGRCLRKCGGAASATASDSSKLCCVRLRSEQISLIPHAAAVIP